MAPKEAHTFLPDNCTKTKTPHRKYARSIFVWRHCSV